MNSDPVGINPPAMVRSEIDADTLLRDAKMFDRSSTESAIKAGELYAKAKEICAHGEWLRKLAKVGRSDRTVRHLISLWKKSLDKSANIADLTDTADETAQPLISPATYAQPLSFCRPCRVGTPKPGCKACKRIRNAQPKLFEPAPEAPKPDPAPTGDAAEDVPPEVLKDAEGLVLPDSAKLAWECKAIEQWIENHGRPAYKALAALEGAPGTVHTNIEGIRKKQHAIANMLRSSKPKHRCKECGGNGCEVCKHAGWVSQAVWSEIKKQEEAKKWSNR
jgi:hypothetical protein